MNKIKEVIASILSSDFNKNLGVLVTGTVIAQAIPIALYPLLTRLYSPEDFGILALYISLMSLLAVVLTGRYELAIMSPKSAKDAESLVTLCLTLIMVTSTVSFLIVLLFSDLIAQNLLNTPAIKPWLYFVPLSAALWAVYQTFMFWANRQSKYKRIALSKITQTSGTGFTNAVWGLISPVTAGLVVGRIVGDLAASTSMVYQTIKKQPDFFKSPSTRAIKSLALKYRDFPTYLLPSSIVGQVNMQLPNIIIANFFGSVTLGFYSLGFQLVVLPTALVGKNLGDVYRQQATETYNKKGNFRDVYFDTLKKSALLGIVPFLVFIFFAPSLFSFFFGEQWEIAGKYSQILSVFTFLSFVITPIDKSALVVGATRYMAVVQVFRLLLNLSLLGFLYFFDVNIETYLWLLVISNSLIYIIELIAGYRFSGSKIN